MNKHKQGVLTTMQLPTKSELISCCVLLMFGILMLWFVPHDSHIGWYAIVLGITFGLFPGPQLKARFEQSDEKSAQWRQISATERKTYFSWWTSPFPWGLAALILAIVYALSV